MTKFSPVKGVLLGVVAALPLATGCVAASDLEKLNQELSRKLGDLRTDLREDFARTVDAHVQQAVNQALVSNYKIEEATLKERLKVLTQERESLESAAPKPHPDVTLNK